MSLPAPYEEHYYIGDGTTVTFPFGSDFKALAEANVKCIIYFDDGTNCVPTFTVNMAAGSITIVTLTKPDGTVLTVPPVGSVVRVFRETPEQQNVTASQLQNYTAKQLEKIFDSIVAMIQENGYTAEHKTLRLTETQRDVSLQNMSEDEDQCLLYWDEESGTIKSTEYTQSGIKLEVERANDVADQAKSIAQTTQGSLTTHTSNINNPHLTSMTNLTDTTISSPSSGQFLMFDGLKWKNVNSSATASWGLILGNITDQTDLMNKFDEYVRTDGTSVMTAPLLMRATDDFKCAIAPYWDGVGFFKLNDNDSVTLMASMEETDGLTPATNNKYNIGKSAYRWKDLYLSGKAYMSVINNGYDIAVPVTNSADTFALLSDVAFKSTDVEFTSLTAGQFLRYDGTKWVNSSDGYADTNLSNLTSTGANIANWSSNVSNCITEIPQDIKLELNNGTLRLKAGSRAYVPNGPGVFTAITTTADCAVTQTANGKHCVYVNTNQVLWAKRLSGFSSGATAPTGVNDGIWYNTTANRIEWYNGAAWSGDGGRSFPIAIVTVSNGAISSIDQVFNGFGFIGNSVYALPGVKGMAPNGRNADGTLKSTICTKNAFGVLNNLTSSNGYTIGLTANGTLTSFYYTQEYDQETYPGNNYRCWYKPSENKIYNTNMAKGSETQQICATLFHFNSTTYFFNSKTPFHAVDYNDFSDLKDAVTTNTTNIATLETSKANTSLDNVSAGIDFVVETQEPDANNNYIWYRKYKSGWVQQGCLHVKDNVAFTFPVAMAATNYSVVAVAKVGTGETKAASVRDDLKTTTDCIVYFTSNQYYGYVVVEGMAA